LLKNLLNGNIISSLHKESGKCDTLNDYVDLVFSFRFNEFNITPIQIKNEISLLLEELLKKMKPHTVMEIGTASGGTLFLLCNVANPEAKIISIDLSGGHFGGESYPDWKIPVYKSFKKNTQEIHLLRSDSHHPDTKNKVLKLLDKSKVDFLLIDGDHTYEGIKKDFEMYSNLISSNGIIAFHDINFGPEENVGGVPKFWNEIKSNFLSVEIVDNPRNTSYGIGLLFFVNKKQSSVSQKETFQTIIELKNKQIEQTHKDSEIIFSKFEDNPLGQLILYYYNRPDLQRKFPEVRTGNFSKIIAWGLSIINGTIKEEHSLKLSLSKFKSKYEEYLEKERQLDITIQEKDTISKQLDTTLQEKDTISKQLDTTLQEKDTISKQLDTTLQEKDTISDTTLQEKSKIIEDKNFLSKKITRLESQIVELETPTIKKIYRESGKILHSSLDILKREGLQSLLQHSITKIKRKEFKILKDILEDQYIRKDNNGKNAYETYLINEDYQQDFKQMIRKCNAFKEKPKISIIMPVHNTSRKFLTKTIESVKNQIYQNWELCICNDGSGSYINRILELYTTDTRIKIIKLQTNSGIAVASNEALKLASGKFVALLDHDDILHNNALYEVVNAVNSKPNVDYIYTDEDHIDKNGKRTNPFFKPDWSSELLRSTPYVSHLSVIRRSLLDEIGGFREKFSDSPDYDVQLRITDIAKSVIHIPKILYSWRSSETSVSNEKNKEKFKKLCKVNFDELSSFIDKKQIGKVESSFYENIFRVRYSLNAQPLVSIIILTLNKTDLLKKCLDSITKKSTYGNFEIIIVTNNSDYDSDMWKYLKTTQYKILKYNDKFSWSKMNSLGVKNSSGEFLLFLNDDTEIISNDWIESMLEFSKQKNVGVVGCKLLFSDGRIQHAGVTSDPIYVAYHQYKDVQGDGYYSMTILPREVSAVTGACMMVKKEVYVKIGGFNEKLDVVFNDIDFCWQLIKNGFKNIYTPFATLYHHEGSSRNTDTITHTAETTLNTIHMLRKWRIHLSKGDPYYNYNLMNVGIDRFGISKSFFPAHGNSNFTKQILLISHNLNLEGATLGLYKIAKYLKQCGYNITIISPFTGKLQSKYNELGIPVIILYDIEHLCKIQNHDFICFLHSFDLVIANTILMYFIGKYVKESLHGIKSNVIWIIRETPEVNAFCNELKINKSDLQIAFKNPDKVVFLSDATKNYFKEFKSKDNFETINDCVDLEEFQNGITEPSFCLLRNNFNVICVGTIYDKKGQDILVDAAKEILQKYGLKNFRFFIIGRIGNQEFYAKLVKKVKKFGLNEIIFTGELNREEVYSFYKNCDVVVLPSRSESFPTAVTEAMAIGKPVIASKIFGTVEQINDGYDGILVSSDDAKLLTKTLISLYKDKSELKKLGINAHNTFLEKFTLEKMGRKYITLITKIIDKQKIF